jgi:hypothetical protein
VRDATELRHDRSLSRHFSDHSLSSQIQQFIKQLLTGRDHAAVPSILGTSHHQFNKVFPISVFLNSKAPPITPPIPFSPVTFELANLRGKTGMVTPC